jgi:sugar lactone lactonase YvrE
LWREPPVFAQLPVVDEAEATEGEARSDRRNDDRRTLAYGYGLIEGPRVGPDGGLYFSDVHNGGVRRLDGRLDRGRGAQAPQRGRHQPPPTAASCCPGKNVCHVRDGETRILYGATTWAGSTTCSWTTPGG